MVPGILNDRCLMFFPVSQNSGLMDCTTFFSGAYSDDQVLITQIANTSSCFFNFSILGKEDYRIFSTDRTKS